MSFPICAITGCAFTLGIVESIVYRRKTDVAVKAKLVPEAALKRRRGMKCDCERLKQRALKSVKGIEQDIRELFGVSQVRFCLREALYRTDRRPHRRALGQSAWTGFARLRDR